MPLEMIDTVALIQYGAADGDRNPSISAAIMNMITADIITGIIFLPHRMRDENEKKKRGRPRAAVPGARVSTWVKTPDYDRLLDLAQRHQTSISGVVRDLLRLKLKPN